jgi:hypothetical protein
MRIPGQTNTKRKRRGSFIYTSFLELVRTINRLTEDDNLVVAAVTDLLNSGRARAVRSMAPVRVVGGYAGRQLRRGHL